MSTEVTVHEARQRLAREAVVRQSYECSVAGGMSTRRFHHLPLERDL
ncbi:MAG TPA: hypothetical protein VGO86_07475 [Candidatus Dormibacteraeota bacterium]